jgi:acetylornithine/N-succinyldiaminopimelate aminotransferase
MDSHLYPTYARADIEFERGDGSWLYTSDGTPYLDFAAGIAVCSLGHNNPHLVETLKDQAGKLWHTSNMFRIPGQERFADRLTEATFADLVFVTNSGTEAMECAFKTARKYFAVNGHPEKYKLITFEGAFHGRSLAAISAGGRDNYLDGFGERTPGFPQVPFGDLEAAEAAIDDETAGFLLEPIQGEGGIRVFDVSFLRALRKLADDNDLLIVLDEVQCGVGRTGKLFAHELAGITPDIMAIAKGIGGGFPVGACLATKEVGACMIKGTHGSTYGGNPLATAVANAVLDIVLEPDFLPAIREKGIKFRQKLAQLCDENSDIFEELRGEGLMLGLKCRCELPDILAACRENKILVVAAGENVIRLLPPLTVSDDEIDEALERLSGACAIVRGDAQDVAKSGT